MTTSFVRRRIVLSFSLGSGEFGEGQGQAVKVEGLRVAATIVKGVGPSMSNAQITVYGLTRSMMNRLSTQGMVVLPVDTVRLNTVTVEAGDEGGALTTVFQGNIGRAFEDFRQQPDAPFQIEAFTALFEAVKPADPQSFGEGTKVATIMENLAGQMGLTFENNGVDAVLSYPYLYGSARNQAQSAADQAGINMVIDDKKLAIWPKGGSRSGEAAEVSPETGMIGYPTYTSKGVEVRTLFNPAIVYGAKINVKSDLQAASGEWVAFALTYDLHSETPGGQWEIKIEAARPGLVVLR